MNVVEKDKVSISGMRRDELKRCPAYVLSWIR